MFAIYLVASSLLSASKCTYNAYRTYPVQVWGGRFLPPPNIPICPQFLREIRRYINTREDGKLYLEDDIFYYARLARQRTSFVPYTNRQVADVQLNFSIADPHEYSDTETESGDINYSGSRPIDEVAHLFDNEGSADTPLYIDIRIGSQAVNNIAVKVYRRTGSGVDRVMILDSPGYSASNTSNYYQPNSRITIDSRERTVTIAPPITTDNPSITHHVRSDWTNTDIQNLPIELPVGETKIGFHTNLGETLSQAGNDNTNTTMTINAKIRNRWK